MVPSDVATAMAGGGLTKAGREPLGLRLSWKIQPLTYFVWLTKESTQYGPGGYLAACWVLARDLLITFASIMNL